MAGQDSNLAFPAQERDCTNSIEGVPVLVARSYLIMITDDRLYDECYTEYQDIPSPPPNPRHHPERD
jgi:hypothetical protein